MRKLLFLFCLITITSPLVADIDIFSGWQCWENVGGQGDPVWQRKSEWDIPGLVGQIYIMPAFGDLDGDEDYDMLVTMDSNPIIAYENTGTPEFPVWQRKLEWDFYVPNMEEGIIHSISLADLNNDGLLDLMVAKHNTGRAYKHIGTVMSPAWIRESSWDIHIPGELNLLPSFADLDDDNDYDAFVRGWYRYQTVFENIGSPEAPIWQEKTDWLPSMAVRYPTFADVDMDGDYDIMTRGTSNSPDLFPQENVGTPESPAWADRPDWAIPNPMFDGATFGAVDIDGDGILPSPISVSPNRFNITLRKYESLDTVVTISSIMDTSLTWQLSENPAVDWLSATPTTDSVAPGESTIVTLTLNTHNLYEGTYTTNLVITCDDSEESAINIPVELTVLPPAPFNVSTRQVYAWAGTQVQLPIILTNPDPVGGWNILIRYDTTIGEMVGAEILDSIWAYDGISWDWYYAPWYQCSESSPEYLNCVTWAEGRKDLIRVVGIMDMNDPEAYTPSVQPGQQQLLFCLDFNVDTLWDGHQAELNFETYECGDNTFASSDGYILWGPDTSSVSSSTCPQRPDSLRVVKLVDGLSLINVLVGDINLNNIPYEVGDAIVFVNYLIYGSDALIAGGEEAQGYASDVNKDSLEWTIADLTALIRVINGYDEPFSKIYSRYVPIQVSIPDSATNYASVLIASDVEIGGIYLTIEHDGEIGIPGLSSQVSNMTLASADENGELKVVIYSMASKTIDSGSKTLLVIPVIGNTKFSFREVQVSDKYGNLLDVEKTLYTPTCTESDYLSDDFELFQNKPNPFASITYISYTVPRKSLVSLSIYDVSGRLIRELVHEEQETGSYNVNWDGLDNNSKQLQNGIYFCRFEAGSYAITKKMILMR